MSTQLGLLPGKRHPEVISRLLHPKNFEHFVALTETLRKSFIPFCVNNYEQSVISDVRHVAGLPCKIRGGADHRRRACYSLKQLCVPEQTEYKDRCADLQSFTDD